MKSLHDQIAGKCKHFNGLMNKTCEVGVSYEQVRFAGDHPLTNKLPCLDKESHTCDKQEFPTEEEVQAQIDEIRESTVNMSKARKAIVEKIGPYKKKESPSVRGVIDCPVCGNSSCLHYSRAAYNGHIHAHCETPHCVSWME